MLLSLYDIVQRCEHDIFAGYCAIGVIIITMMMMMIIMMMTMKRLVPLGFLPRTRVCVIVCMCVFVCARARSSVFPVSKHYSTLFC